MTTRLRTLRMPLLIVPLMATLAWPPCVDPVPGQPVDETTLAIPAVSLALGSAFIAEDLGLWEKEGLRVRTSVVPGIGAPNAALARSVDFAVGTAASVARANTRGQRLFAIMQLMDRFTAELVVRKDVADKEGITATMPLAWIIHEK